MFWKFRNVIFSFAFGVTVGHEPGHGLALASLQVWMFLPESFNQTLQLGLVTRMVFELSDVAVKKRKIRVLSIRHRPVEESVPIGAIIVQNNVFVSTMNNPEFWRKTLIQFFVLVNAKGGKFNSIQSGWPNFLF